MHGCHFTIRALASNFLSDSVRDGCKPQTNGWQQWQNQSGGSRLCQPEEPPQKETMSPNVHVIYLLQVSFQSK